MIASIVVVAAFVPDIDLIIVVALVSLMAIYDFWETLHTEESHAKAQRPQRIDFQHYSLARKSG